MMDKIIPPEILMKAAKDFGTPLFITSTEYLHRQWLSARETKHSYKGELRLAYSYKTNYLPSLCRFLHCLGAEAEVVSEMELELAVALAVNGGKIIFNGPGKGPSGLRRAIDAEVGLINIETLDELSILSQLAKTSDKEIPIGVRIDPHILAHDSKDPRYREQEAGRVHKFGWHPEDHELEKAWREATLQKGLRPVAWHVNLGSMICSSRPFVEAASALCDLARLWDGIYKLPEILDLGGGFGIPGLRRLRVSPWGMIDRIMEKNDALFYESCPPDLTPKVVISQVATIIERKWPGDSLPVIIIEPGRYVVSGSTFLLTSVIGCRTKQNTLWIYLDGGINLLPDLICNDGREIHVVRTKRDHALLPYHVAGPLCLKADVLARNILLPGDIRSGDLVAVGNAGAYGFSRSSSFSFPRAPVIFYTDGKLQPVWRRESLSDHILSFDISGYEKPVEMSEWF